MDGIHSKRRAAAPLDIYIRAGIGASYLRLRSGIESIGTLVFSPATYKTIAIGMGVQDFPVKKITTRIEAGYARINYNGYGNNIYQPDIKTSYEFDQSIATFGIHILYTMNLTRAGQIALYGGGGLNLNGSWDLQSKFMRKGPAGSYENEYLLDLDGIGENWPIKLGLKVSNRLRVETEYLTYKLQNDDPKVKFTCKTLALTIVYDF